MQPSQAPFTEIKQKLSQAKSIVILLPQNHTADNLAAGLGLYLSLIQNYASKPEDAKAVSIATSPQVKVAFQRLYGVGSIINSLGSKNLVITLRTNLDSIEKVTSDNENGVLNLIIETKTGTQRLDKDNVEFSYRGIDADLVIAIDLLTPEDLGQLLISEPELFQTRETITIASKPGSLPFGTINFQDTSASGVSEMMVKLLRFLHLSIDEDIATNLIAGIEAATNNLMIKTTADTFAALSWCMHSGGKRFHLESSPLEKPTAFPRQIPDNSVLNFRPNDQAALQTIQSPLPPQDNSVDNSVESPQKDWLEPKIYKTPSTS